MSRCDWRMLLSIALGWVGCVGLGTVVRKAPVPALPLPPRQMAPTPHALPPEPLRALGTVIRLKGFDCDQPIAGMVRGPGPYGLELKVRCETESFQVIARPNEALWVRPWASRLT
jgi:hypothetical protein